jgi:hypothetical protein
MLDPGCVLLTFDLHKASHPGRAGRIAMSIAQGHGVFSRIGAGIEGHRGYEQDEQDEQDRPNVFGDRRGVIVEKPATLTTPGGAACFVCFVEYCAVVNCRSFGDFYMNRLYMQA